jgi:hypothetical protein
MARGWESKAIEEQQAEAGRESARTPFIKRTPAELARQERQESLRLSRSQLREQLQRARNETQRRWLSSALEQLETELAQLDAPLSEQQ